MTTAAATGFVIEEVDLGQGFKIYIDGNQKITAGNGTFDDPAANAFSLPQVVSCPMRTPTCEASCYVHNLETHQGWLHDNYKHNLETITNIVDVPNWPTRYRVHTAQALGFWIENNAQGGFRWHVSGDLFSERYANWVANVVRFSQDVKHWIYTRSFHLVPKFLEETKAGQITVNLSADKDNYWMARRLADQHNLRVCYLTVDGEVPDDLNPGDVIFPDYALRGVGMKPHTFRDGSEWWQGLDIDQRRMVCPTDAYGKSENVRCGPCDRCIRPTLDAEVS